MCLEIGQSAWSRIFAWVFPLGSLLRSDKCETIDFRKVSCTPHQYLLCDGTVSFCYYYYYHPAFPGLQARSLIKQLILSLCDSASNMCRLSSPGAMVCVRLCASLISTRICATVGMIPGGLEAGVLSTVYATYRQWDMGRYETTAALFVLHIYDIWALTGPPNTTR